MQVENHVKPFPHIILYPTFPVRCIPFDSISVIKVSVTATGSTVRGAVTSDFRARGHRGQCLGRRWQRRQGRPLLFRSEEAVGAQRPRGRRTIFGLQLEMAYGSHGGKMGKRWK